MRSHVLGVAVTAVLLLPQTGSAQVYQYDTPAPRVTAARAHWQLSGEPLFYAGAFYYPTGPTEFFDGRVMARTGFYEGMPLYENSTLEPYSIVFVPIGGNLMRPYERRREGDLAGTVGSRTPSFPIQRDAELASMVTGAHRDRTRLVTSRAQWDWPEPQTVPDAPPLAPMSTRPAATASPAPVIRSVPRRETTNAGAFVEFEGTRYFTSGRAVVHDAQRFVQVGDVRGASVFREAKGDNRTIFVEVVPGGTLAPYTRK